MQSDGQGHLGCCKLCYACGTQTLIITSSAGNGADEYPCWPQKRVSGAAAVVSSHIILYWWKWKEDRCPVRSGATECDYITKEKKRGEDSIWEEVYHTGRVALVLVRDWERGALITAHNLHLQGSGFGCLSILLTEIQSVSQKRSMTLLEALWGHWTGALYLTNMNKTVRKTVRKPGQNIHTNQVTACDTCCHFLMQLNLISDTTYGWLIVQ